VLEKSVAGKKSIIPRALLLPSAGRLHDFRRRLLAWFRARQRPLPWRQTRDPYRIWISEVMLQQTRVAAVLPFYQRFVARFPSVRALARAPVEAVLEAWAGLGYYTRARNLQRAAKEIVRKHRGRFPQIPKDALALPGVGRYTAAAVLSIAHGAPLAVLDGNVARVLARLGARQGDVRSDLRRRARWQQLESAAQRLLPRAACTPGAWNQAMMELGATVCTPRAPACGDCPVANLCRARAMGLQEQIPGKRVKRAPVDVRLAAAVLLDPLRRTLLVLPEDGAGNGLFSRMWQFPAVEITTRHLLTGTRKGTALAVPTSARSSGALAPEVGSRNSHTIYGTGSSGAERKLRRHLRETLGLEAAECVALPAARHTVTFRRVTLLPFLVPVEELPRERRARTGAGDSTHIALADVERWPTSSATRKIARAALRGGQATFLFPR